MKEKEKKAILDIEEDLARMQVLEVGIKSTDDDGIIQSTANKYAGKPSLYTQPKKMKSLLDEMKADLNAYIKTNNIQGTIMGEKAMSQFLDKSEAADYTQNELRLIAQGTKKQAKARLKLAYKELELEHHVLKEQIKIFKLQSKIAGFSDKETLSTLVKMGKDKTGMVQAFAKKTKSITVAASRREKSAAEIEAYALKTKANEKWVWITISKNVCPDCQIRAGTILTLDRWQKIGMPGQGRTICGPYCMCKLRPQSIAKDAHETVKEFKYDPENGVLTTAGEARTFNAKSNKYKEPKK